MTERELIEQLRSRVADKDKFSMNYDEVEAGAKVKALEWNPFRAETPFGVYAIEDQQAVMPDIEKPFLLLGVRKDYSRHKTIAAAKAAAQADYERRILSALDPSPDTGKAVPVAWPEHLERKLADYNSGEAPGYSPLRPEAIDLQRQFMSLAGHDKNQPGYRYRLGWNDAIRHIMDLQRVLHSAAPEQGGENGE